ncbi:MAG TPA: T9SS type A sorting domain-containing protein [Ignavibacteriaceae bacterium]
MKTILAVIFLTIFTNAQVQYTDMLKPQSIYTEAPTEVKSRKAFIREWWFYEQRSFPNDFIPVDAYKNALDQRELLRQSNEQLALTDNSFNIPTFNWVSLGPTSGAYFNYGNISSRIVTGAFDPTNANVIYIGPANGGVWKSTDAGISWMPLTDQQVSLSMGAIEIDPTNSNIIYAGTGEATYSGASYYGRGLLKSTDAGNTWTNFTSGLPSLTYFSRIKIRPSNSVQLLAALGNNGLYRSTNSGTSWTQIISGRIDDVAFTSSGDTVFAVGGSNGLRRSIDGGATFSAFGSGLATGTRTHFDICLSNPAYMYAAVYGSIVNLYKSTNYGADWSQLTTTTEFQNQGGQAWYDLYIRVNPKNPNKVYVGTIDVYRSTDGTNFTNITNGYSGGNVHVDQHFLFFHPTLENTFFVCNDGGIWKTTNNGDAFTNYNQYLTLTQFYRIAASPFTPSRILGGTQDNGTQQTYSTLNWSAAYGGDGGEVCFNPFNSNFILGETQNGGLFRTTNGGSSWSSAANGINTGENVAWVAPIIAHPTISGTFFVARQKVYRSTDNGGNWTAISANVNGSTAVREMAISRSDPSILFATSSSSVFKSTDAGVTWTNVTSGLPSRTITSVSIYPTDPNQVFLTFSGFGSGKVYKSTNGGSSWISISGNLPDTPVNDIFIYSSNPGNPSTYFAATDVGIFLTENDGTNWVEISNDLPNTVVMHLDYSPGNQMLRAGTHGRGVYEAFVDFSIPVELISFAANQQDKKVVLNWRTATETNNSHFEVERKFKNQDWEKLDIVAGAGTITEFRNYFYEDDFESLPYNGTVLYRLKQVDYNGTFEYSNVISVDVEFIPTEISISQNYPNPFNPVTAIKYWLNVEANVNISIYNSLGQVVEQLVNNIQSPGNYSVSWNAENYASGIYFYSFEVSDQNNSLLHKEMKKLIFLK